ncbi:CTHL2 protein, partial [Loxia leucoptera]|nr:CTHL2 protein [Loxia leucoptera]
MPSSWVLVLAVLGGACALPAQASLSYIEALAQAVDAYNEQPEVQNTFRLLSAEPEPGPGVELSSLRRLNFSMMETDCAASARANPDDCDFKENGVRRRRRRRRRRRKGARGPAAIPRGSPASPHPLTPPSVRQPVLIQRGRFGRFLRKVRRFRPRIKFDVR